MRVIEVARFGAPDVLVPVDVPEPVPGPEQVVVDVVAADVLWLDTAIRWGLATDWFPIEPPYRPGPGVAGTVTEVGPGVDPAWLGRRVVASTNARDGYAQRALVPVPGLTVVPDAVSLTDAAALLHDGTTAMGLLAVVGVRAGERVLVTAAAGGLGALLVQLAHAAGATVVAAASGAKLSRVEGADMLVDYTAPDWTASVGQVDVVFDGAGHTYGRAAFDLVADGGRFSAHGSPAGGFTSVTAARGITVTGIHELRFAPEQARRHLGEALGGRLRPLIGQRFPLDRAADAHTAIEARSAVGKTLLIP